VLRGEVEGSRSWQTDLKAHIKAVTGNFQEDVEMTDLLTSLDADKDGETSQTS